MTSAALTADAQASSSSPSSHRPHKHRVFTDRDARRLQLLQQQKQARRDFTNQARAIIQYRHDTAAAGEDDRADRNAADGMDEEERTQPHRSQQHDQAENGEQQPEEEEAADDGSRQHHRHPASSSSSSHSSWASRRLDYAAQFQLPQWMDAVPGDLAENWLLLPRPEGSRCFVISHRHRTFSRKRNGMILHSSFSSTLPGGAHVDAVCSPSPPLSSSASSGSDFCILDCIFNDELQSFFCLDLLCWKGYMLWDTAAEFRMYWMQQKLAELPPPPPAAAAAAGSKKRRAPFLPLLPLPVLPAVAASLPLLYPQCPQLRCHQDGLLFYHKQSHYAPSALPSPLCLLWKDSRCSRWSEAAEQAVLRRDAATGDCTTQDGLLLGRLEAAPAAAARSPLVRVRLQGMTVRDDGSLRVERLLYAGETGRGRVSAETSDRLLWSAHARNGSAITIDDIAAAMTPQQPQHQPPPVMDDDMT